MPAALIRVVNQFGTPMQGVTVTIFDLNNQYREGSSPTDAAGEATFTLATGYWYVRLYGKHLNASVPAAQRIKVVDPPPTNEWELTVQAFVPPACPDPAFCRVWGFFRGPGGAPQRGHYIRLAPQRDPVAIGSGLAGANGIGDSQHTLNLHTDSSGYVQVDLPRGGAFDVVMSGYLDTNISIEVPDAESWCLPDLIFPTPVSLTFDPVGPVGPLGVGGTQTFTPSLVLSDGRTLTQSTDERASDWVDFEAADETVLTVTHSGDGVTVTGRAGGATTLGASVRDDVALPRTPTPVFAVTSVSVTV